MQGEGYRGLLGDSQHSWGWDLGRKRATHQGQDRSSSTCLLPSTHLPPPPTHLTPSPAA